MDLDELRARRAALDIAREERRVELQALLRVHNQILLDLDAVEEGYNVRKAALEEAGNDKVVQITALSKIYQQILVDLDAINNAIRRLNE